MARVKEFFLPDDLYYDAKEHIWARDENGRMRVGLDAFGACAAGTVAYVRLLPAGRQVQKCRPFGSMEAGKYVGPLKAPVSGTIEVVNQQVVASPAIINRDHYDNGWFVVLAPSSIQDDIGDLVHGDAVQPWLAEEVRDYEDNAKIKPEAERQCE